MHGVALRMIMPEDVKKVSGWFGYKRHYEYAEYYGLTDEKKNESEDELWDLAEEVGDKEREVLDCFKKIISINKEERDDGKLIKFLS